MRDESGMPVSPFKITHFVDFGTENHNKGWVVEDLLGAGEMTVWYGYPGTGKSVAIGDAAAHIAAGMDWLGRKVTKSAVVIIAAERGPLVRRRFAAWGLEHQIDGLPLVVVEGAFDFVSGPDHADEIIRIGRATAARYEIKVGLLVIDTKLQVMSAGDPNSDKDTHAFVANVRSMQAGLGDPHAAIVDHVPHAAPERIKGSGALGGAADGSLLFRLGGALHTITVGSKPFNDGPEEFSAAFTLKSVEVGQDANGKVTTAPVVVPSGDGPAGPRRPISATGQKVMAAYGRLIDAEKTYPAPVVPGVAPGTRAVALGDLRDMATALGIFPKPQPGADADSKEQTAWRNGRDHAWTRGIKEVTGKGGALRLENEWVWEPYATAPMDD